MHPHFRNWVHLRSCGSLHEPRDRGMVPRLGQEGQEGPPHRLTPDPGTENRNRICRICSGWKKLPLLYNIDDMCLGLLVVIITITNVTMHLRLGYLSLGFLRICTHWRQG